MTAQRIRGRAKAKGVAFLITIIFVALFASMAVALATTSDMNLLVSRNRLESNQAAALVETGLLLAQKELGGAKVSGASAEAVHASIAAHLRSVWESSNTIDASAIAADSGGVVLPSITLTRADGRTGTISLVITSDGGVDDTPTIEIASTGRFAGAVRTAYYDLGIQTGLAAFRDYGAVSKSGVVMRDRARIGGANTAVEGSVLSASDDPTAINMYDNTWLSGNAGVTSENSSISLADNASIGGEQVIGVNEPEWPEIDTSGFQQYVEEIVTGDVSGDQTLHNIRIPAGTNPTFDGNINIYGVIYVESPNVVTFQGNTNIVGMIVTEEPPVENFSVNKILFKGDLTVSGVENLPDQDRYDGLRDQTGTFMLAPGFRAKFKNNFSTIPGVVAAGQLRFVGNANGTVRGGLLNLSNAPLVLKDYASLTIDKQNADPSPAGFGSGYSLVCVTGSYKD